VAKLSIKPDSTSVSLLLFIQDSASTTGGGKTGLAYNTASLTCYGVRPGEAAAAISLVTQTVTGAWSSGGFVEIDSANMPGMYRFDVPNARLAAGVRSSAIMFKGASGMAPLTLEIDLNAEVNVTYWLGAAAPANTGDSYARLGAPAGASVSADVLQIRNYVDDIGVAGAGLTEIGDTRIANLDAAVSSRSTFAGGAVASVTGNVGGNVVGSVASVTAPVTAGTVSDKTGYALSSAGVQAIWDALTSALNAYDPPTNTEMEARTLAAANYATATVLDAVGNFVDTEVAAIKAVTDKLDTALVLDGAVYQLTANALELAPTGSGSGATAEEVWEYAGGTGRTINSVLGTVSAQLADGVVHGGSTAELSLKKIAASNTDNQGVALSLRGGNFGSPGTAIELIHGGGTSGTGIIKGYVQGVVEGVPLSTEAIHDISFDATGLNAIANAVNNLAPASTGAADSIRAKLDAIKLTTDAIDTSAVTVTSSNNAGVLTFTQGSTFNATVSGLTISATWAKLYFTLKESDYDPDDLALLQLVETNPSDGADGLLYLAGDAIASPITVSDGTLTVSQAAGTVAIAITDNATAALSKASGLVWDIKTKDTAGATVQNTTGTASIMRAVTQTI